MGSLRGFLGVPVVGLVGDPGIGRFRRADERVELVVLLEALQQRLARLRALDAPPLDLRVEPLELRARVPSCSALLCSPLLSRTSVDTRSGLRIQPFRSRSLDSFTTSLAIESLAARALGG